MQIDPYQSRMRWALFIFILTFNVCWIFLAVMFNLSNLLLSSPLDFRKQHWILFLMGGLSVLGALSMSRFYWSRSIRRGRLKSGLCIHCGKEIGFVAETCPHCGKEQPRGKVSQISAFPVLPIQKMEKDESPPQTPI